MRKTFWSAVFTCLLMAGGLSAQTSKPTGLPAPLAPAPRLQPTNWLGRHEGFVAQAKKGGIDLLFLGDSITDAWRSRGINVWKKAYGARRAANFGISGDRTQDLLWRLQHGELDGIKPKAVVLMIGTNNSRKDDPDAISEAIKLILAELRSRCPDTKVLLLAVFPRNKATDAPHQMPSIHKINELIAKFDDARNVRFLNINRVFLGPDGKVPADIMPDFLHPNEHGYQLWADAMEPILAEMLK
jgi:lysophospholipase L1-like esterase